VLREGPLHAAIKAMLAAPGDRLEVPVGRFVIDVVRADGELVEVQTGGFGPLGCSMLLAQRTAYCLRAVNLIEAAGKDGRARLHRISPTAGHARRSDRRPRIGGAAPGRPF